MNTIRKLCDRCIVMDHGKIVFNGDVNEGISRYLGTDKFDGATKVVFNTKMRADFLQNKNKITLKSFELLDKTNSKFYLDDVMKFKLEWDCSERIKNLSLRIKLVDLNGVYAANYFLESFINVEKQSYTKIFEMDLRGLMYGSYSASFVFSYTFVDGRTELVEAMLNAFGFEIKRRKSDMYWSSPYWGYVKLDGIKLLNN